jgi:hypothetical protein
MLAAAGIRMAVPLHACTVCFGAADSPLIDAARAGVLVMAGVTVAVLAGFGRWFLTLRRLERTEARRLAAPIAGEQP